jgi:outer membrane protein assembly factor BamD
MLLKSKYLLAINSVEDKRQERLSNALDEYFAFIDEYPESDYRKEIDKFYNTLADLLNYDAGQETNIN